MAGHPLADWLGETDDEAESTDEGAPRRDQPQRPRRRLALLAAAAAVLWAAVAVAFLLGGDDEEADADPGGIDGLTAAPAEEPAAPAAAPPLDGLPSADSDVPPAHAARAVVGTRLEVSRLAEDAGRNRYVDTAVAEGAERVGDLLVVTVLAVVLEGDDGAWTSAAVERFAVPVAAAPSGEPALAGAPWPLPAPDDAGLAGPTWHETEAPSGEITGALEAAGFAGISDLETARSGDSALLRASFTTQDLPGRQEVWLTEEPHTRVLGLRARDHRDTQGGH